MDRAGRKLRLRHISYFPRTESSVRSRSLRDSITFFKSSFFEKSIIVDILTCVIFLCTNVNQAFAQLSTDTVSDLPVEISGRALEERLIIEYLGMESAGSGGGPCDTIESGALTRCSVGFSTTCGGDRQTLYTCGDWNPYDGCGALSWGDPQSCPNGCANGRCSYNWFRVFVTSQLYDGNLGGIAGADEKCQSAANEAQLGGKWMAWISADQSTTFPANRFLHSAVPYQRIDGVKVADDWADLIDSSLDSSISVDEFGNDVSTQSPSLVWTSTISAGQQFSGSKCNQWTSNSSSIQGRAGNLNAYLNAAWSTSAYAACSSPLRLYCFEQPVI